MKLWTKLRAFVRKHAVAIRVVGGWITGGVTTLVAFGPDAMAAWTPRRWAAGLFCAFAPGFLLMLRAGEPNPSFEELRTELRKGQGGSDQ